MRMSDNISNIATALAKAQGEIDDATKGGFNPAFKSKYADLAAVRAAIREPLAINDLSVVQFPRTVQGGVEVETMILHKSGEYLAETLFMPVNKYDAHGIGSGITYGRRYGLMALLGIATDDDDGNAAAQPGTGQQVSGPPPKKVGKSAIDSAIAAGEARAKEEGSKGASSWWAELTNDVRAAIPDEAKARIKGIGRETDAASVKNNVEA